MPEEKLEQPRPVEKCPSCGMDNKPYAGRRVPGAKLLLRFYECWNCGEKFFREGALGCTQDGEMPG